MVELSSAEIMYAQHRAEIIEGMRDCICSISSGNPVDVDFWRNPDFGVLLRSEVAGILHLLSCEIISVVVREIFVAVEV